MPDTLLPASAADLAALIGSRICHDLISPLGAIGNGVELLTLSGVAGPEAELIRESVGNANARLKFFRVAFGAAGADQRMGRPEIAAILAELTRGGRLSIDWTVPGDLPRAEVKLAFLLLQCAESALPRGGQVTLARDGRLWTLTALSPRLRVEPPLWDAFAQGGPAEPTPAQVHFALAARELAHLGRSLTMRAGPDALLLTW